MKSSVGAAGAWLALATSACPCAAEPPAPATARAPASPAPPTPAPAAPAVLPGSRILSAGTVVTIALDEALDSSRHKSGDRFAIRLAEPILLNGQPVVAAGAPGYGEVVDSAGGGMAGRPGKLIIAARYVEQDGVRVPLRGFRMFGKGEDNSTTAFVLSGTPYVGVLALAITGGAVQFPRGYRAHAKVAADVTFPAPPSPAPAPSAPASVSSPTSSPTGTPP